MRKSARQSLADNLNARIDAYCRGGRRSMSAWAAAHKLEPKMVHRAINEDVKLEATLQVIADKLRVEPWELLYPVTLPGYRPSPAELTSRAIDVAQALDRIKDQSRRDRAYALMVQLVEFENVPTPPADESPPSPVPTAKRVRHR